MKRRDFLQFGTIAASALVLDSCGRMSDIISPQQVIDNPFQLIVSNVLEFKRVILKSLGMTSFVGPTNSLDLYNSNSSGLTCDCEEFFLKTEAEYLQFIKKENLYHSAPTEFLSVVDYIELNRDEFVRGLAIEVDLFDNPVVQQNSKNGKLSAWSYGAWFGDYRLRFEYHYGYVSGCIKKNINHINLSVNTRDGGQLINIHIAAWKWSSYDYCFGIYESSKGNSWCSCPRNYYDTIFNAVLTALVGVGIYYGLVWAIAQLAAAISVSILVV